MRFTAKCATKLSQTRPSRRLCIVGSLGETDARKGAAYGRIYPNLMALTAGERLGPYEILGLLGAGGMGEVYKARDPRLNRDVAIKVSHAQFSERFEREARVIASLNHPNICHLYDIAGKCNARVA